MATFTSRTITARRREFIVPAAEPWGADYGEIAKAALAARAEYRQRRGLPENASLPDDVIRFFPRDDKIVIAYLIEEVES